MIFAYEVIDVCKVYYKETRLMIIKNILYKSKNYVYNILYIRILLIYVQKIEEGACNERDETILVF